MATSRSFNYDPQQKFEIKTFDVEYSHHLPEPLLAKVYQPQGAGPFPTLMDVHGGAWNFGTRNNNELMDTSLASNGLLVVAVDFRLAPQHPFPAQTVDVNYATRWVKAHASDFNGDSRFLGGLGSSSGGQTIMLSAMRPRDPRYCSVPFDEAPEVDAALSFVLACWPVLDPYARYLFAKRESERLVGASLGYFVNEENMRLGNPQLILERGDEADLPPMLVVQGTADDNVPLSIPQRFEEAYRGAGGSINVEWFEGQAHAFASKPGPASDQALVVMKEFVARQLASFAAVV